MRRGWGHSVHPDRPAQGIPRQGANAERIAAREGREPASAAPVARRDHAEGGPRRQRLAEPGQHIEAPPWAKVAAGESGQRFAQVAADESLRPPQALAEDRPEPHHRLLPDLQTTGPGDPRAAPGKESRRQFQVLAQRVAIPAADRGECLGPYDHAVAAQLARTAQRPSPELDLAVHGLLVVLDPRKQRAERSGAGRDEHPATRSDRVRSARDEFRGATQEVGPDPRIRVQDDDRLAAQRTQRDARQRRTLAIRLGTSTRTHARGRSQAGTPQGRGRHRSGAIGRAVVHDRDVEAR